MNVLIFAAARCACANRRSVNALSGHKTINAEVRPVPCTHGDTRTGKPTQIGCVSRFTQLHAPQQPRRRGGVEHMILLYFRISGAGSPRIAPSHTPYWQAWRMQRARGTRTFVPSHAYKISTSHPYGIYVCDLEAARMWRWPQTLESAKSWQMQNTG